MIIVLAMGLSGFLLLSSLERYFLNSMEDSLLVQLQLDTRIRILDPTGLVFVDSSPGGQGASLETGPLVAQAAKGETAGRTEPAGRGETDVMHLAVPVMVDGKLAGLVRLSQPLRDVTAVLYDLRTRWLISTAAALLLSGAAGRALSRAIARPLRRLTTAAGVAARGHLDQQVPVRSRDEVGQLSRAFNDMTDRLRAARQMQVDFVADVSHELRTPLTSIKGLVETLRRGAVDDKEVRDRFLQTMESETDRLIRLVRDLLLLSRADSEVLNLEREPVDLALLAKATADRLRAQASAQGLALKVEAGRDCPTALADPDRIEQVLLNLLDNAIKFSPTGGAVTIRVGRGPDRPVEVQVQDEGIGIPAEQLARIGQRFYRADKARSRADGGSGLGLVIARALEAHGGRLWVKSREGQGTASPSPCRARSDDGLLHLPGRSYGSAFRGVRGPGVLLVISPARSPEPANHPEPSIARGHHSACKKPVGRVVRYPAPDDHPGGGLPSTSTLPLLLSRSVFGAEGSQSRLGNYYVRRVQEILRSVHPQRTGLVRGAEVDFVCIGCVESLTCVA